MSVSGQTFYSILLRMYGPHVHNEWMQRPLDDTKVREFVFFCTRLMSSYLSIALMHIHKSSHDVYQTTYQLFKK